MTSSLGWINLLEQGIRETLTYVYQFFKGYDKDTDEQMHMMVAPDKAARSSWRLGTGLVA